MPPMSKEVLFGLVTAMAMWRRRPQNRHLHTRSACALACIRGSGWASRHGGIRASIDWPAIIARQQTEAVTADIGRGYATGSPWHRHARNSL